MSKFYVAAFINDNKLVGYSLNLEHSEGKHKARVFQSALNLDSSNVNVLKSALLEAVKNQDATPDKANEYGQKYVIDFSMAHQDKTAIVHSVWIVLRDENFPRLVTCYVL